MLTNFIKMIRHQQQTRYYDFSVRRMQLKFNAFTFRGLMPIFTCDLDLDRQVLDLLNRNSLAAQGRSSITVASVL